MPAIDQQEVSVVYYYCVAKAGLDQGETVTVKGIINSATFYKSRLQANREKILEMLCQMPLPFRREDGESFQEAIKDCNGNEWTPFHATAEMLALMAIGLQAAEFVNGHEDTPGIPNLRIFV